MLCNLLEAVAYLHTRNLVHRDIQPCQVSWFDASTRWRLGVPCAWAKRASDAPITYTLRYAAPEVHLLQPLGLVFYVFLFLPPLPSPVCCSSVTLCVCFCWIHMPTSKLWLRWRRERERDYIHYITWSLLVEVLRQGPGLYVIVEGLSRYQAVIVVNKVCALVLNCMCMLEAAFLQLQ